MTNDQARLDEAVARVLNLRASRNHPKGPIISYWDEANNWERIPCPSQDWNALMAAVARLEERGKLFIRSSPGLPGSGEYGQWQVSWGRGVMDGCSYMFGHEQNLSETEALARCILAVVEKEDD